MASSGPDTATAMTPSVKEFSFSTFDSVSITFVHIEGAHAYRDQVFFRQVAVRPMLWGPLSCLSCMSVCNVGVLWPNGWMYQDATCYT